MHVAQSLPTDFNRVDVINVHQGDCYVSGHPDVTLSTVLGSCVSACVRDVFAQVGGMNHFLLAHQSGSSQQRFGASARYGAFAMEELINKVLSAGTGCKNNLEIKVFGGGNINASLADVGAENAAFVRNFLSGEGYQIAKQDIGGGYARRVLFKPLSGRVFIKRLDSATGQSVVREELAIATRQPAMAASGAIELF